MIRTLRHICLRLCISAVIWVPLVFIFLTRFGYLMRGKDSIAAAIILFVIFFTVGFLMDQTGKKLTADLVKEAKSWEQAGIYKKSEEKYIKALWIYDSFLLVPWKNKKTGENLTGSIAKFSLACSIKNPAFDNAVTAFLLMSPKDTDIAILWLERLCSSGSEPGVKDKEILTCLAEVHIDNPEIVMFIADIFTKLNRCDFTARKIYKKAMNMPDLKQNARTAIKECLGTEDKNLSSFAVLQEGSSFETDILRGKGTGKIFKSGIPMRKVTAGSVLNVLNGICCLLQQIFKQIFTMMTSSLKFLFNAVSDIISFIKQRKKFKFIVKWGISAIICMGIIILMVNTFSHLFSEKKSKFEKPHELKENIHKTEHVPPGLFTIQVAAYLKKKYGDAYVAKLKAKGLDAYLSKTEGGGKTWFIVRISEFPDKKTASQYGKKLKNQGYIDDFFVDNTR